LSGLASDFFCTLPAVNAMLGFAFSREEEFTTITEDSDLSLMSLRQS